MPIAPIGQTQTASAPFTWGKGGRRLTPDQIVLDRRVNAALMQPDFSPVSHWTQGLGRVAQNLLGAWQDNQSLKAQDANTAAQQAILANLMNDGGDKKAAINEAISSPYVDDATRQFGMKAWERENPKPTAPHYWETNNGSLGMVGPDGKPQVIYQDPTPKIEWITAKNPDGTLSVIPIPQGGALGGQPPAALPTAPVGKLTPIDGGPTPSASATFP